jgi:hypothetical protein
VNKHFVSVSCCFLPFAIPTSFKPSMKKFEYNYVSVEPMTFRVGITYPAAKSRSTMWQVKWQNDRKFKPSAYSLIPRALSFLKIS